MKKNNPKPEGEYNLTRHQLTKSVVRLRYLYYSLSVFILILLAFYAVLLSKFMKLQEDIAISVFLGIILLGLIAVVYILFKNFLFLKLAEPEKPEIAKPVPDGPRKYRHSS